MQFRPRSDGEYRPALGWNGHGRDDRFQPPLSGGTDQHDAEGRQFASAVAFPNFCFHAAFAHGLLRHNGVEVGKRDFLGVS
jgi:hypothetical protein